MKDSELVLRRKGSKKDRATGLRVVICPVSSSSLTSEMHRDKVTGADLRDQLGPRSQGSTLMKCILKKSTHSLPGARGQAPGNHKTLTFCLRILYI